MDFGRDRQNKQTKSNKDLSLTLKYFYWRSNSAAYKRVNILCLCQKLKSPERSNPQPVTLRADTVVLSHWACVTTLWWWHPSLSHLHTTSYPQIPTWSPQPLGSMTTYSLTEESSVTVIWQQKVISQAVFQHHGTSHTTNIKNTVSILTLFFNSLNLYVYFLFKLRWGLQWFCK